jgi:hypothetical protein
MSDENKTDTQDRRVPHTGASRAFDVDSSSSDELFFEAPKFTGTNYGAWAKLMRCFLRYYNLWDVVEAPIPGMARSVLDAFTSTGDADTQGEVPLVDPAILRKCERAYCILVLSIASEEAMELIDDVPDDNAHELWKRLKKRYEKNPRFMPGSASC